MRNADSPGAGSGGLFAARVDARDVRRVLLRDDRSLDLHRRGHLAARLGEVDREDAELADLLGPRHREVRVRHRLADRGAQVRVVDEVGERRARGLAGALQPAGERIGVDR